MKLTRIAFFLVGATALYMFSTASSLLAFSPTQNPANPWSDGPNAWFSSPADLAAYETANNQSAYPLLLVGFQGPFTSATLFEGVDCSTANPCMEVDMMYYGPPGGGFGIVTQYQGSAPYGQVCADGSYAASGQTCAAKSLGALCHCANSVPLTIQAGDPIDVGSGNVFEQAIDYETTGQNKLRFVRYYNSRQGYSLANELGMLWRSNYDRYIRIQSSSVVFAERADGQQLQFTLTSGGWTPDSDVDVILTSSGSTWTLTDHDDTVETYTTNSTGNLALLNTIQARNGYTQTLNYASGMLASVSDSYGRSLGFGYTGSLLRFLITPDSTTISYSYASVANGANLASVTYPTSPSTSVTYVYGNSALINALTGIIDEDGNTYATWTYDAYGRGLTTQLGQIANLTTASYNDATGGRTVTNSLGVTDTYTFSVLQGIPKVMGISRAATSTTAAATESFSYDSNGYLASKTDWNGNTTNYTNNAHGLPTQIVEAYDSSVARTTTIAYDSTFVHLPDSITTPGLTTSFTYDASGNVLTRTLTDTTSATLPYSTSGQARTTTNTWSNFLIASSKSPNGNTTSFRYDGSGALVRITNALAQVTNITAHTGGGLPQTVVDPNGVTTSFTYDARQRLLTSTVTTASGPLTTTFTYDAAGNLITAMLPDGSALTNTFDTAHRLIGTADLFTDSIAYTLDAAGDRTNTAISNPQGTLTRHHSATFDTLGRLLDDIGGVGQTTIYSYDADSNALTITDPLLRTTAQSFDALNRVTQITNPAQGNVAMSYDPHDRPVSVTDPNGNTTAYTYDGFGDVIQEVSPARGTTVYHYDLDGNLVQKVDARGAIANNTFDALDRVAATAYPADASENVAYVYDQAAGVFGVGRLTSVTDAVGTLSRTYDERGNVLTESRVNGSGSNAVTLLTQYGYDAASRIISIVYPSGTAVAYARDTMGRVTGVTAQPAGTSQPTPVLSTIAYQPFGPPNGLTYGNAVAESRSFDLDYRLTALSDAGNNPIQSLSYGYNAANDVTSITDGVTSGNSQSFGYDALDRLVSAAGGYGSLAYTYDANGNRLTETPAAPIALDGLSPTLTTLTYNQAGRLSSTSAGALLLTQYAYDAFGQRLEKATTSPVTFYQYDQSGDLLEEINTLSGPLADYIYLDGRPIAVITPSTGALYFLHDDRLDTPQLATSVAQATAWQTTYQPFGATDTVVDSITQNLRLPGQYFDEETGWNHNGFRDYMPSLGRYLEADPIGLVGGLNTYFYANSNPERFTDISGLLFAGLVQWFDDFVNRYNEAFERTEPLATPLSALNAAREYPEQASQASAIDTLQARSALVRGVAQSPICAEGAKLFFGAALSSAVALEGGRRVAAVIDALVSPYEGTILDFVGSQFTNPATVQPEIGHVGDKAFWDWWYDTNIGPHQ